MLKQTLVGRSCLRGSELALGTMTFGDSRDWSCPEDVALAMLKSFAEARGTTVDTAPNFADGRSEAIVGAFARASRQAGAFHQVHRLD